MFRRLATSAAALALALGSLVALSAPASAATRITCPTHTTSAGDRTDVAWETARLRGFLVDTYTNGTRTEFVYAMGGIVRERYYEVFSADFGLEQTVIRTCYRDKPERPASSRERYRESGGGGGGGGGVSLGAGVWYVGNSVRVGIVTVGTVEDLR
ncbi:MAG: hypothetical protein GX593_05780 [Actinomycetales bacterium]|nr:hypothetical protein [Actinomycetales bacterium]